MWTTMAEVGSADDENKVCMILEAIPVSALMAFAEDFTVLKTQGRLMQQLPELKRYSVSVLGNGFPALIIETEARTDEEKLLAETHRSLETTFDQAKTVSALKSFINRVVVNENMCPYTKDADISASGLETRGVEPGPVGYRFR